MKNTAIKYHPRLFITPMVQAILEGRKTQTRRTDGLEELNKNPDLWVHEGITTFAHHPIQKNDYRIYQTFKNVETQIKHLIRCPYENGDVLWVKETYIAKYYTSGANLYRADDNNIIDASRSIGHDLGEKWTPSIFMKKEDCRLFLKIKSIRVERLQDISEDDAKAEGAKDRLRHIDLKILEGLKDWKIPSPFLEHQFGFLSIWCTINGCDNWIFNPWVWVYEFEQIEKPLDFIV